MNKNINESYNILNIYNKRYIEPNERENLFNLPDDHPLISKSKSKPKENNIYTELLQTYIDRCDELNLKKSLDMLNKESPPGLFNIYLIMI